jgi:phosphopantetheine adenylyltransferase
MFSSNIVLMHTNKQVKSNYRTQYSFLVLFIYAVSVSVSWKLNKTANTMNSTVYASITKIVVSSPTNTGATFISHNHSCNGMESY